MVTLKIWQCGQNIGKGTAYMFLISAINIGVFVEFEESSQLTGMNCITELSEMIQSRFPTRYYPLYAQRSSFVADQLYGRYTKIDTDVMDFSSDLYIQGRSFFYILFSPVIYRVFENEKNFLDGGLSSSSAKLKQKLLRSF